MNRTTLCYIEMGGKLLMLHRTKKKNDENADKYIGLGGHFLDGETPEECVIREVFEESGLTLRAPAYRGIVDFHSNEFGHEEMHLFTASLPGGTFSECDEGDLCLVEKEKLFSLKMWEGDKIFLSLLFDGAPFFKLSLYYEGERLVNALLDGKPSELFDLCGEDGRPTGRFKERSLVHRDGDLHATVHIWLYRHSERGIELLLQKRAADKDSFPGVYDISCAGHLSHGEDFGTALRRELSEELGIDDWEKARFLTFCKRHRIAEFYGKTFDDNELSALWLYDASDLELSSLRLQKEELSEVRFFAPDELPDAVAGGCLVEEELAIVLDAIEKL